MTHFLHYVKAEDLFQKKKSLIRHEMVGLNIKIKTEQIKKK